MFTLVFPAHPIHEIRPSLWCVVFLCSLSFSPLIQLTQLRLNRSCVVSRVPSVFPCSPSSPNSGQACRASYSALPLIFSAHPVHPIQAKPVVRCVPCSLSFLPLTRFAKIRPSLSCVVFHVPSVFPRSPEPLNLGQACCASRSVFPLFPPAHPNHSIQAKPVVRRVPRSLYFHPAHSIYQN